MTIETSGSGAAEGGGAVTAEEGSSVSLSSPSSDTVEMLGAARSGQSATSHILAKVRVNPMVNDKTFEQLIDEK